LFGVDVVALMTGRTSGLQKACSNNPKGYPEQVEE